MGSKKSKEELIDLYLFDKLLPQDRKNFEEEILCNEELRKEVEAMQRIMIGFERKGEVEAIDAMQNMSEEQIKSIIADAESKYKPSVKRKWLYSATIGIAASIALLLYIGLQPKYSSVELYDSFYTHVEYDYMPSRGGDLNEDQEHLLEQATVAYNQGKYAEALTLFESIATNINAIEVSEEIKFYTALCMAQTGKESDAIKKMEYIASSVDSEFKDDAMWNLALLYLKVEDRNKCSNILKSIIDDKDNLYASDASQLLNKLNDRRWF